MCVMGDEQDTSGHAATAMIVWIKPLTCVLWHSFPCDGFHQLAQDRGTHSMQQWARLHQLCFLTAHNCVAILKQELRDPPSVVA